MRLRIEAYRSVAWACIALGFTAPTAPAEGTTIQTPAASVVANATIDEISGDWDQLGSTLGTEGDWAAVAADGPAGEPGVFVFQRQAGAFVQVDLVTEAELGGLTPGEIELSGDTFCVFSTNGPAQEVRIFRANGTDWSLEQVLTPSDFGIDTLRDVDLSADTLAVCGNSQVSVWVRNGFTWSLEALVSLTPPVGDDVIALDGDTFFVGGNFNADRNRDL